MPIFLDEQWQEVMFVFLYTSEPFCWFKVNWFCIKKKLRGVYLFCWQYPVADLFLNECVCMLQYCSVVAALMYCVGICLLIGVKVPETNYGILRLPILV